MTISARWLGGLGLGAALMFLLDPDRGRRRRAVVRDRIASRAGDSRTFLRKSRHDVANRTRGLAARARTLASRNGPVEDDVLVERVRAKLGRYVTHPGPIDVVADAGEVTLRGPVGAAEIDDLLSAVRSVRGVRSVTDRLEVHDGPDDGSGLQRAGRRRGETGEFRQQHWSPTARIAAGTAGGALFFLGLKRHGPLGLAASAVGTGLLARSVANKSARRLAGFGGGTPAYDVPVTYEERVTHTDPTISEEPSPLENPGPEDWAV